MKYSVSTCSFVKLKVKRLLALPEDIGVEIFYEYGSEEYWEEFLSRFQQTHSGGVSIHSPFAFYDFSAPGDDAELFEHFKKAFGLYHRFDCEFYVLHAFNNIDMITGKEHADEYRSRSIERIGKFDQICKAEGIQLAVENTFGNPYNLFSQEQWLGMFASFPDLHALIDVGHALVAGMSIEQMQATLRDRIVGYHLHNNDTSRDSHSRILEGCMKWEPFVENARKYTPNAAGVIEYLVEDRMEACVEDIRFLEKLSRDAR